MRRIAAIAPILISAAFFVTARGPEASQQPATQTSPPSPTVTKEHDLTPIQQGGKPTPPLQIPIPEAMPDRLGAVDLKDIDADRLQAAATQMQGKDYTRAATLQYWAVQKSGEGQYNLACYLARIGRVDAAFYFLQKAAIEEGVDGAFAARDSDLVSLRKDPRWAKVRAYLDNCNHYFETAPLGRTVVLAPKGYKKGTPIAAIVWMHGMGSRPDDFANEDSQEFVDELGVALIGVSGTKARGPRSFVWADDPEVDARRLDAALEEVGDRVTIKTGHLITFGFSQGAQLGLEIAVRNPEKYAGSIALSPGATYHLAKVTPSPLLAKRGFVVSCGAKEAIGNVLLTSSDASWLTHAKAKVQEKKYPGVSAHSFPSDFSKRFPEWVKFILETRGE